MFRRLFFVLMVTIFLSSCSKKYFAPSPAKAIKSSAKNIIFMIVDGMGFEYIRATRIYNGMKPLSFEKFPCQTKVTTCSIDGADKYGRCVSLTENVTDSAAAATAIATGIKVENGVVSQQIPGNKNDVPTILEIAAKSGKSTGIIATKLFTDATPASFASHAKNRGDTDDILRSMFQKVTPNIIFGADNKKHIEALKESSKHYIIVDSHRALARLTKQYADKPCILPSCPYVYGGFGQHELIVDAYKEVVGLPLEISDEEYFVAHDIPRLHEMTKSALSLLSQNPKGFFLMVESSNPDTIGHHNRDIDKSEKSPSAINALIKEMLEVQKTADVLEEFVKKYPDTLVILTADHETGGLRIHSDQTSCMGQLGCIPTVEWTSDTYPASTIARHTNVDVPLYAIGKTSERFCSEKIDNTDIINLTLGRY